MRLGVHARSATCMLTQWCLLKVSSTPLCCVLATALHDGEHGHDPTSTRAHRLCDVCHVHHHWSGVLFMGLLSVSVRPSRQRRRTRSVSLHHEISSNPCTSLKAMWCVETAPSAARLFFKSTCLATVNMLISAHLLCTTLP